MDTQSKSLAAVRQHLIARGFDVEFKNYVQNLAGKGIIKMSKPRLRVSKNESCNFALIFAVDGKVRVQNTQSTIFDNWDVSIPLSDPQLFDKLDGVIDLIYKLVESELKNKRSKNSYFRRKSPF